MVFPRLPITLLLLFGLLSLPGDSQTAPATHVPRPAKPSPKSATRAPKRTPEQTLALRLLNTAEAESSAADPPMRTFLLLQIAQSFSKLDPSRQEATLERAFNSSLAMEDRTGENCRLYTSCMLKTVLQTEILRRMLDRNADAVFPLLPSAEPDARRLVTAQVVAYELKHHRYERAQELLASLVSERGFPYQTAGDLIDQLPPAQGAEKLTVFQMAFTSYQQHGVKESPQITDFASLVIRFSRQLPPAAILDATDWILSHAKDPESESPPNLHMTISGDAGDLRFSNSYEYRLFELLPVLQELDPSRAASLLEENASTRALLAQYPRGFQSFAPTLFNKTNSGGAFDSGIRTVNFFADDSDPAKSSLQQAKVEEQNLVNRRMDEIERQADTNPKQALADALSLPVKGAFGDADSPRVTSLLVIASKAAGKQNFTIAKSALDEMQKPLPDLSPAASAHALVSAADTYGKIGEVDAARKALTEANKFATSLYQQDSNANDPNQAFKAFWPSTQLWRQIIMAAGKLSPDFAQEMWTAIPDPEIVALEKVRYAASLLSASTPMSGYQQIWHKNEATERMMEDD